MCETLRRFARGPDAPQIHLLCVEEASDEVDPPAIARPEREMIMPARSWVDEDFSRAAAITVRDEHRVAWLAGVVCEPRAVGRPGEVDAVLLKKIAGRSAEKRHSLQSSIGKAAGEPNL